MSEGRLANKCPSDVPSALGRDRPLMSREGTMEQSVREGVSCGVSGMEGFNKACTRIVR